MRTRKTCLASAKKSGELKLNNKQIDKVCKKPYMILFGKATPLTEVESKVYKDIVKIVYM